MILLEVAKADVDIIIKWFIYPLDVGLRFIPKLHGWSKEIGCFIYCPNSEVSSYILKLA